MPVFVENPAQFSKPRLKSELIAHNVSLPAAESKKHVYVELYSRQIGLNNAADFSSDDEDAQESQDCEEEQNKDSEMMDTCGLTDKQLQAMLLQYGVKVGPIVGTTRSLYERKLQRLMELAESRQQNETVDVDRYSYSEDELEDVSDSQQGRAEPVSLVEDKQPVDNDPEIGQHFRNNTNAEYHYPQCFLPSSRMRVRRDPGCSEFNPRRNAGNHENVAVSSNTAWRKQDLSSPVALEDEANQSRTASILGLSTGSVVPTQSLSLHGGCHADSSHSSQSFSITEMIESRSRLSSASSESKKGQSQTSYQGPMPSLHWQEAVTCFVDKYTMTNKSLCITPKTSPLIQQNKVPIKDVLMEMFPETNPTPTGIAATRRRPIKGAAGRPVDFKYPGIFASPMAQQRQAVERHLVPLWVQILVFLILGCLLYVIYAAMEISLDNPFVTLLDNLSMATEKEMSLQA
ncbi:hypothetical protein DPEC_G00010590 [Dallia pectoralis]|uniref:Uncharacterized protein n=1 Tax=Dallia pectoralis TaxID=75939 RepID=A0ACC2HLA7_DALPE|nr:hypothetical protein DPEC_G00010590 [Dallia pectoralis]